jgi:hypothetical protein
MRGPSAIVSKGRPRSGRLQRKIGPRSSCDIRSLATGATHDKRLALLSNLKSEVMFLADRGFIGRLVNIRPTRKGSCLSRYLCCASSAVVRFFNKIKPCRSKPATTSSWPATSPSVRRHKTMSPPRHTARPPPRSAQCIEPSISNRTSQKTDTELPRRPVRRERCLWRFASLSAPVPISFAKSPMLSGQVHSDPARRTLVCNLGQERARPGVGGPLAVIAE